MADGTTLEKRGIPTAVIVTAPFVRPADAMARRQGYPDFKYATMPHPIGNLKMDQIRKKAEDVLPRVLEILGLPV